MAVSLSSAGAALRRGVSGLAPKPKKTKKVTSKTSTSAKESAGKLREWLPITPKGSWEHVSEIVANAARRATEFGGNSEQPCWFISIWASFPDKSAVVIANSDSGKLWLARYEIDDEDNVTFPVVKDAESSVTVSEALKRNSSQRRSSSRITEGDRQSRRLRESVHFTARIREIKTDDKGGAKATCVMLEEGPGNTVDGHYYLADCFESAAAVFEGAQSFADHADEIEERIQPGRSIRDLIGWWSDVHVEEVDGSKLLVGDFNIESGNEFALNKMREAKKYRERYADQPEKQYVGFSISAGGISETREIAGKTYNAVLRITEAGSTDMVTRAGAGGKMLSLQEAQRMAKTATNGARKNEQLAEIDPQKLAADVLKEAGITLDDEDMESFVGALGDKLKGGKKKPSEMDDETEAAADDEDDIAGDDLDDDVDDGDVTDGDDDINDVLADKGAVEARRKEAARTAASAGTRVREDGKSGDATKLRAERDAALAENAKLKGRIKFQESKSTARALIRELKVPKSAQAYVLNELLDVDGGEKPMREKAVALLEGVIRPLHGDGVTGNPARIQESASAGILSVSGIAE